MTPIRGSSQPLAMPNNSMEPASASLRESSTDPASQVFGLARY